MLSTSTQRVLRNASPSRSAPSAAREDELSPTPGRGVSRRKHGKGNVMSAKFVPLGVAALMLAGVVTPSAVAAPEPGHCYNLTDANTGKSSWSGSWGSLSCDERHTYEVTRVERVPKRLAKLGRSSSAVRAFAKLHCLSSTQRLSGSEPTSRLWTQSFLAPKSDWRRGNRSVVCGGLSLRYVSAGNWKVDRVRGAYERGSDGSGICGNYRKSTGMTWTRSCDTGRYFFDRIVPLPGKRLETKAYPGSSSIRSAATKLADKYNADIWFAPSEDMWKSGYRTVQLWQRLA